MNGDPWTVSEKTRLRDLYAAGHSFAEIGRCMGRTKNSIMGEVKRSGMERRGSPIRPALPIPTHFKDRHDVDDWRRDYGPDPLPVGAYPLPPLPSQAASLR